MIPSGNKSFTAIDIERYHKGTMSPEERHALEKAALDDPFLADALEGYAFTQTPAADLATIRDRLNEKTRRKKIVPLFSRTWMRSAAVIVLVAAGGWLVFRTSSTKNKSVAIQKVPATDNAVVSAPPMSTADSSIANKQFAFTDSVPSEGLASRNTLRKKNDLNEQNLNEVTSANNVTSDFATPDSSAIVLTDNYKDYRKQEDRANANGVFNNNVRQNNAKFNAGRSSEPSATNNGSINQELYKKNNSALSDTSFAQNYARLDKAAKPARDTIDNFNVVLQEQKAPPTEVVVIAHGQQRKESIDARMRGVVLDTLEPAEGWTNFDDYVANNLQMPDELKKIKQPSGGEVQLSFDVDDKGDPVNIKVEKSLCAQCDDEAIRLLKQGPKWKKKKNKKGKVTIKF